MGDAFEDAWDVLKARAPVPMRRFYKKPTQTTAGAPAAQRDVGQPVPSASQNVDVMAQQKQMMEQQRAQEAQRMNQLKTQDPEAYQKILLERAYAKREDDSRARMADMVEQGMQGGTPMEKAFVFLKEMRMRTDLPDDFQMNPETTNAMLDCAACGEPSMNGRFCEECSKRDCAGAKINPATNTSRINTQMPPNIYNFPNNSEEDIEEFRRMMNARNPNADYTSAK